MTAFVQRVHGIYEQFSPYIYPYIGKTFIEPYDEDFRMMAVGINAYSVGDDFGKQAPAPDDANAKREILSPAASCAEVFQVPCSSGQRSNRG
jgi:hypothetical protein